jgi:hypothetical protein
MYIDPSRVSTEDICKRFREFFSSFNAGDANAQPIEVDLYTLEPIKPKQTFSTEDVAKMTNAEIESQLVDLLGSFDIENGTLKSEQESKIFVENRKQYEKINTTLYFEGDKIINLEDCEENLKEELLEFNPLDWEQDWIADDYVQYNIFGWECDPAMAEVIIRKTMELADIGYTPKDLGLSVEDNWVNEINKFLCLSDEDREAKIEAIKQNNIEVEHNKTITRDQLSAEDLKELERLEYQAAHPIDIFDISDLKAERQKSANSKGGKKGGKLGTPKKSVRELSTGKIYDSVSDFAAAHNHKPGWASKHKELFEFVK